MLLVIQRYVPLAPGLLEINQADLGERTGRRIQELSRAGFRIPNHRLLDLAWNAGLHAGLGVRHNRFTAKRAAGTSGKIRAAGCHTSKSAELDEKIQDGRPTAHSDHLLDLTILLVHTYSEQIILYI